MNIITTYKATPPPKERPTWIHFCILLWSAFWRLEPKNRANVGIAALVIVLPIGLGFMALMDKIVQATHADQSFKHDRMTMLAPASITLSVEDAGKPSLWQPTAEPKAKRPPQKRDTAPRSVKELAPADVFGYIERWKDAAIKSARKTGIPASITLAQGIVESNSGRSYLAVNANNHFGIKCSEGSRCKRGHCVNREDDTHKDFFRKFPSVEACFVYHGKLLSTKRYKPLHEYGRKDYKAWAYGLKRVGYATDPNYAEKLIGTIEKFGLHKYD